MPKRRYVPRRPKPTPELDRGFGVIVVLGGLFLLLCFYVHSLPTRPIKSNRPAKQSTFEKYRHLMK
ncbi:hypothetical protein LCGC14_2072790 [marine sediment metagenome]|uniref:Uncharacterized protein n=1 Tax=marine sediment metagenome TaxID=412755 RepID=A0A0F9HEY2_9ZZZZ